MSSSRHLDLASPRPVGHARVVEWKPARSSTSTLLGTVSIAFSGGWTIPNIPVFRNPDGLGVGVPRCPQLDADGRVRERDGKRVYENVVGFETTEARRRWESMIRAALADAGIGANQQTNRGDVP